MPATITASFRKSIMKTITKDQFVALLDEAGITDEQIADLVWRVANVERAVAKAASLAIAA